MIGVAFDAGMACVHVLFIRQGKVLGSRSYFPKVPGGTELGEVVETFVGQFYLQGSQMRTLPGEILLDFNLSDKTLLADSLSDLPDGVFMSRQNRAAIAPVISSWRGPTRQRP